MVRMLKYNSSFINWFNKTFRKPDLTIHEVQCPECKVNMYVAKSKNDFKVTCPNCECDHFLNVKSRWSDNTYAYLLTVKISNKIKEIRVV